jgi:hypothetical protein
MAASYTFIIYNYKQYIISVVSKNLKLTIMLPIVMLHIENAKVMIMSEYYISNASLKNPKWLPNSDPITSVSFIR